MYKHTLLVFAVAMAAASAVERADDGYYNSVYDGGMDSYGYQMPANYYGGHDLVYAPYHNEAQYPTSYHNIHKRSPGILLFGKKAAALTGAKAFAAAPIFGKKAFKATKLGAFGFGGAGLLGKKALVALPATGLGAKAFGLGSAKFFGKKVLLG